MKVITYRQIGLTKDRTMKSDTTPNRFVIECDCHSLEHLLVFESWDHVPDKDNPEKSRIYSLDAYFTSNYKAPWYKRVIIAFNYIFKLRKHQCISDSVIMNSSNIKQLEEVIQTIKGDALSDREQEILQLRSELKEIGFFGDSFDFDDRFILDTIKSLIKRIKQSPPKEL